MCDGIGVLRNSFGDSILINSKWNSRSFLIISFSFTRKMYMTILGSENEKKIASTLCRNLKKGGEVIVDNHHKVLGERGNDDPCKVTQILAEYARKESTTSLIVISSAVFCKQLAAGGIVPLHVNGTSVQVDTESLKKCCNDSTKSKVILVTFSPHSSGLLESFQGCEHLELIEKNPEVEISPLNISRVVSAMRRRNKERGMYYV